MSRNLAKFDTNDNNLVEYSSGTLLELKCETDFVALTDAFQRLVRDLAVQVAGLAPRYVDSSEIPSADLEARRARVRWGGPAGAVGRPARAALRDWLGPNGRPAMVPARWARRHDAEAGFLNPRGGGRSRPAGAAQPAMP